MRDLPTRKEWAAQAEHAIRTRCFPHERVPQGAEHYLAADELTEMAALVLDLSKATKPILTGMIDRLRAEFPDRPVNGTVREKAAWYLGLTDGAQAVYGELRTFEEVRADLTRQIRGSSTEIRHSVFSVAGLVPDQAALDRLRTLCNKATQLRNEAAEKATDEAVAAEIARRKTDKAWERELKRRAIPAITVIHVSP